MCLELLRPSLLRSRCCPRTPHHPPNPGDHLSAQQGPPYVTRLFICVCLSICSYVRAHLEREWPPSWRMCGLYWARMVTVSHCCPMISRACCSVALRRLMPLN